MTEICVQLNQNRDTHSKIKESEERFHRMNEDIQKKLEVVLRRIKEK